MRPPNKSRSRNKNNRRNNNNNGGNVLNRVYDSAGPDGRVRGTPVQVIEKYQALAHDNSLAGDRVAMENFQQHAEHYIRLINEAQRQIAERREQIETQNRNSGDDNKNNNNNNNGNRNSQQDASNARPNDAHKADPSQSEQPDLAAPVAKRPDAPKAADASPLSAERDESATNNGGLVDTPEDGPAKAKPKRQRRPKQAAPKEPKEEARPAE